MATLVQPASPTYTKDSDPQRKKPFSIELQTQGEFRNDSTQETSTPTVLTEGVTHLGGLLINELTSKFMINPNLPIVSPWLSNTYTGIKSNQFTPQQRYRQRESVN